MYIKKIAGKKKIAGSNESRSENCSVMSDFLWSHGLYSPWNSPGQNTGVGSLSLLQGIFPTQGLKPGLPHCRQILYQLSHKGSPAMSNLRKNKAGKGRERNIRRAAAAAAESPQSCPTLCDPTDGLPPGSPVPGTLQARTLEWVAISFSKLWVKYRQIWGHFNLNPSVKIFNKLSSFKLFYSYINTYKKMARHLILH